MFVGTAADTHGVLGKPQVIILVSYRKYLHVERMANTQENT